MQEFQERQDLQQVSVFEATVETASLPQAQRRLDPQLAIAKFRRSAAGSEHHHVHSTSTLTALLQHLITIGATLRPTANHAILDDDDNWQQPWTEFLVDRLRACQADATRLLDTDDGPMPSEWYVQMVRLLLWVRYWMPWNDAFQETTTRTMLSTALEQYWSSTGTTGRNGIWDDEMLSYSALLRLSKGDDDGAFHSTLLDFAKYAPVDRPLEMFPRFDAALKLSASLSRGEYYPVLHPNPSIISILGRCCLAPRLAHWRYQQCRRYNVSFGKDEAVPDLDRLLCLDQLSVQQVEDYLRLPCSQDDHGKVTVIFKQHGMTEDPPFQESYKDHAWVFATALNGAIPMKIPSAEIQGLLQSGSQA
jgi:hypothetical protein